MRRFAFVGERQSLLAAANGWQWADERVAAKTLFRALRAAGIDPVVQTYCNLWTTPGTGRPPEPPNFDEVQRARTELLTIVALGRLVSRELTRVGIPHICIKHPAARGAIRRSEVYNAHVREILT